MTPCTRWREELIDRALGQPAGASLSAHIATCAGCAATLAGWQARMSQLDAGVRTLVAREPSSNLGSRALAGTDPGTVRFARGWRIRAAVVGALAIAGILFVTYDAGTLKRGHAQSMTIAPAGAALSHWRAPTDVLLQHE
jgi:anti-sigma factor RsiW